MSSQLQSSTYRYNSYTSTNGFFILRVPLIINGQLSMIDCSNGMLTLNCRLPSLGITFDSLFNDVNAVVKKYRISQISNYWCEDVPLFELQHSTPAGMEEFIRSAEMVQTEIASRISAQFAELKAVSGSSAPRLPVVAHTEVYLLTPDPANKDASLEMVTPENVSFCLAVQKKREVFNFGELFRRYRQENSGSIYGPLTLKLLLEDLNEIVEWYQIGIHLDIPRTDLEDIKCESDNVTDCRCKMLSTWFQRNHKPKWATIITALTTIGRRNLAYKMALKYGVPVPRSMPKSEKAPTLEKKDDPIQQKLTSRVAQLQHDIQLKDMELVIHKQTTTEARNARDIARGKVKEVGEKAVEIQTKISLLIEKSCDTQKELDLKQDILRALQERKKEEFQGIIDYSKQEVQKSQKEFEVIQAELAAEREKAHSLPEQLQQAARELAEKSAKVEELEGARQKLETLLEHERKSVNQLQMQATVASDSQQHSKEIKNQLDAAKKELVAKTEEIDILKQTIANRDEEVESLHTELRAKEALLQVLLIQLSQATIPDPAQQLKLQRLTKEVSELRAKLSDVEDAKQEAERQMEDAKLTSSLLREIMRDIRGPPFVPPKPTQKPLQKSSEVTEAEMAIATWEYKVFTENSAEIIAKLANVKLAGRIADELSAARIIGRSVRDAATVYGPSVTEDHRIRPIIVTLNDKIQQDAQVYHQFRHILLSLGPDTKTALYYMPKTGPRAPAPKPRNKRVMKGHATEQQKMTLQWGTGRATPGYMERGSAATHGKMAYFNSYNSRKVYQFDVEGDKWVALLDCPNRDSAMVVTTAGLTTVGGHDHRGATNSLATLTGEGKKRKWVELYPRMPTSRYYLAAVCRGRTLIATGGRGGGRVLRTVEVLDTESLQWTHVSSLPHPMSSASITVWQGKIYLLGGNDQNGDRTLSVFTCSMSNLLQTQPLDAQLEKTANQLAVWHQAANAPHYHSTAVSIGDVLLAVGGRSAAGEVTSAIVSYNDATNSWQDIEHMTIPRSKPMVVLLPSNELIVAGGYGAYTKVEIGKVVA